MGKNFDLYKFTADQLLNESPENDRLIYEDDVCTLLDGKLVTVHHEISLSQARAIMRKIVDDDVINEALRASMERAKLFPDGNMPINGAHPVDPAKEVVMERAILPVLGTPPPVDAKLKFMGMAYDRLRSQN